MSSATSIRARLLNVSKQIAAFVHRIFASGTEDAAWQPGGPWHR